MVGRYACLCASMILAGAFGGCTPDEPELPEGWSGAQSMLIKQSSCAGDPDLSREMPNLSVDTEHQEALLALRYEDAVFRCGQQACGYRLDFASVTRVLIQPCEMRPSSVPRCDCLYDITFKLPRDDERTAVELFRRGDLHGAKEPVAPTFVDRQDVAHRASH